ncbi:MAG: S9 family peptidase, partial [Bacteroidota bacterium]|nr:S9 family peptidase [Bacteroidota bacterium]
MKKLSIAFLFIIFCSTVIAQTSTGYKMPPKDVADLLLAKPTPSVSFDSKGEWMLLSERNPYPTVEELGQPEIRLAGLRLNPSNFSPSRQTFINNFRLKNIKSGKEISVTGLPQNLLATNVNWSPSENKIAFLNTTSSTVDLYLIDIATQKVTRLNKQPVNNTLGTAYTWVDDNTVLYKATIALPGAAPKKSITPKGPT